MTTFDWRSCGRTRAPAVCSFIVGGSGAQSLKSGCSTPKGNELTDLLWPIDDPPFLTATDFILLNPGEFLGTQLKIRVKQFAKSPGDYELFVEYKSYLSEELARKYVPSRDVPFWSRDRNTVTSNRIKLRVKEQIHSWLNLAITQA